jgi:uncharacterized cupredoxin-like copper-binding protein
MRNGNRHAVLALLAAPLLVVAACGGGGHSAHDGAAAARTVEVEMRDIHYEPASVSVRAGETVKFVFRNVGEAVHDAFIGDEAAQAKHEKEMRDGGGHHGGDDHAVTVNPGKTASLTYTFKGGETLLIGCHQAGHYQAGMKVNVTVV